MSDPKILVWPADKAGCGHHRLILPALALAGQGADVTVDFAGPIVYWSQRWEGDELGNRPPTWVSAVALAKPVEADVVIIQRPGGVHWQQIMPMIQAQGVKVVVDVDDLFDDVHPAHIGRRAYKGGEASRVAWMCEKADLVTGTTPAVLDRYGYGHSVLLPNLIPRTYLTMAVSKLERTVGWSGMAATHPGDLGVTEGVVQPVLDGAGWEFRVIGSIDGVQQQLGLSGAPQATGWILFDDYPYLLAELEVGIVPLEPSRFNAGKSCLKAMEMAALGVPLVMSPIPDNLRLHKLGVGLLAESRGQWRRQLGALVGSVGRRQHETGVAREAAAGLTYEEHCGRWADAWQSVVREKVTV